MNVSRSELLSGMKRESSKTDIQTAPSPGSCDSDSETGGYANHNDAAGPVTRIANILRAAVIVVLLVTAATVSVGIYIYTRNEERDNFHTRFRDDAHQVIESFHQLVERNIGSSARLSTAITSYSKKANMTFPFITIPDFEMLGSHLRVLSGSHIVHWAPLVTEEKRAEWEEFAMEHRAQIDEAYDNDVYFRAKQDAELKHADGLGRELNQEDQEEQPLPPASPINWTMLEDGTGFHPRIWQNPVFGKPRDELDGEGPYIPSWQRSPIDPSKQSFLNLNFAKAEVIVPGTMPKMMIEKKAILSHAVHPAINMRPHLEANLRLSQYREHIEDLIDGLSTFLVYPVFDCFEDNREVAGVLLTNIYWKILFTNLLPAGSGDIICVVESSYNQTFSYRVQGSESFFIGMGDHHDPRYDELVQTEDVSNYLEQRKSPQNRAYQTVSLSDNTYRIRVYPSKSTEGQFMTNKPVVYTAAVIVGFAFASTLFLLFSYVVERRQHIMMEQVIDNARRATLAERELNEFLSHEVRNPLSAAMSACSFVSTAVNEANPMADEETRMYVREDIEVVNSSLHFINDFLRSMLDIHRDKQIKIQLAPTDILRDIFEPVSSILYKRVASFEVIVECPTNLMVMTDSVRLKQVVLNLVRNSSKFVERGFLRMRADVVNNKVSLHVEDSGPGISAEKKKELFAKYQESLDLLSQGTGIGLNLSKKLMKTLNGDLRLADTYNSGIEGYPGASFVVDLKTAPLDLELTFGPAVMEHDAEHNDTAMPPDIENGVLPGSKCQNATSGRDTPLGIPITGTDISEVNGSRNETARPSGGCELQVEENPGTVLLPPGLSVLFVDDDAVLRKLFVRALKKVEPSWKIQEASSGETALRLCEVETFDVIFLDQYMASVDKQLLGTETAQAMRTRRVKSKICGLSANDLRDAFINSGADEFILKPLPCKVADLKLLLSRLLAQGERPRTEV